MPKTLWGQKFGNASTAKCPLWACSHECGTVNYPQVMIAPGQALPRVHMIVAPGQLHCPGASSTSSDHYEFI